MLTNGSVQGTKTSDQDNTDFLGDYIAKRTAKTPGFSAMVAAAEARREALHTLAERRESLGVSQTAVAAAMKTSQSTVARLETTAADTKLSTLERFAAALGLTVEYRFVPVEKADSRRAVVLEADTAASPTVAPVRRP